MHTLEKLRPFACLAALLSMAACSNDRQILAPDVSGRIKVTTETVAPPSPDGDLSQLGCLVAYIDHTRDILLDAARSETASRRQELAGRIAAFKAELTAERPTLEAEKIPGNFDLGFAAGNQIFADIAQQATPDKPAKETIGFLLHPVGRIIYARACKELSEKLGYGTMTGSYQTLAMAH